MTDGALIARIAELERRVNGINAGGLTTSPNLRLMGGVQSSLVTANKIRLPESDLAAPTDVPDYMQLWGGTLGAPWWEANDFQFGAMVDAEYVPMYNGYPTGAVAGNMSGFPSMIFDATNTDYVELPIPYRPHWGGHRAHVIVNWASDNVNTGNVRLTAEMRVATNGTNITTGTTYMSASTTTAAPGQYLLKPTNFYIGYLPATTYNTVMAMRFIRTGGDAADTHTGSIHAFGMLFVVYQY